MTKERKNWRMFLAATVVGVSTVSCAPAAFGQEKQGDGRTTFEVRPTETLKTYELFWPPTLTVTPSVTATREPTPTKTFTPTSTSTPTATQTETLRPTNTATLTVLPTVRPSPSITVVQKETERKIKYPITHGDLSREETALAIDDGWDKKAVEDTLKTLKERNVKATFFVVGQCLEDSPDLWKKALADGHQICNHSATHAKEWKDWISAEKVQGEILGWEKSAVKVLGKEYLEKMKTEFPYVRFPYGGGNRTPEILKIAEDLGYIVIGWNSYGDGGNGSIALLHFIPADADKLERVLDGITKRGLKAVTVSEVLK